MIEANIILDSVSPDGHRLTTFKLRYPRFIHSEFMTHRTFSRNASSSRAVPVGKRIAEVEGAYTRARPVHWGFEQGGMQADWDLEGVDLAAAMAAWDDAAVYAARAARNMQDLGLHKQVVNRILEPFLHIDVVCTATEYMNFFGLRLEAVAQPEMRMLSEAMWRVYDASTPAPLRPGDWHLPFVTGQVEKDPDAASLSLANLIKISVARCARVSYFSHVTGKRSTLADDMKLYERLVGSQPLHASPAEHQGTPDVFVVSNLNGPGTWLNAGEHGNFIGWRQYRKALMGEACAPLPAKYQSERTRT